MGVVTGDGNGNGNIDRVGEIGRGLSCLCSTPGVLNCVFPLNVAIIIFHERH